MGGARIGLLQTIVEEQAKTVLTHIEAEAKVHGGFVHNLGLDGVEATAQGVARYGSLVEVAIGKDSACIDFWLEYPARVEHEFLIEFQAHGEGEDVEAVALNGRAQTCGIIVGFASHKAYADVRYKLEITEE